MRSRRLVVELGIFLAVTILFTYAASYLAYMVARNEYPKDFWELWNRWDAQHYIAIATIGYEMTGEGRFRIAFFPIYPLVVRLFYYAIPNPILAALLVSNIAFGLAAFYLYRLARLDYPAATARRAVIFFSIFPTAYFFHAAYTESLFLLLTVASFYYARTGKWLVSSILAMFAAATRITGILLLPALLIEYLAQRRFQVKQVRWNICFLLLIPIGIVFYLYINYLAFNDPFAFLTIQREHWTKHLALPIYGLKDSWACLSWRSPQQKVSLCGAELVAGLLGFGVTGYALAAARLSYSVYMLLTWTVATSTAYWMSLPRYLLMLFPMYIAMAVAARRPVVALTLTFTCTALYALFMSLFAVGPWAF